MIFVNDGSTDETGAIANRYGSILRSRGHRFVYLEQPNGGQAKALNLGFPYIKGKYFIWPDCDDILCNDNLSTKIAFMESHPRCALGISSAVHVNEDGDILGTFKREPRAEDNLFRDLLTSTNVYFCPGIYILKTEAFRECYPDMKIDESRAGQNYQLLLPVSYSFEYGYIDRVLYRYVLHPSSHSNAGADSEAVQLSRFCKHEKLLCKLVKQFCTPKDRDQYLHLVNAHFQSLYLRIANRFCDRKMAFQAMQSLFDLRSAGLKDVVYAFATFVGISLRR